MYFSNYIYLIESMIDRGIISEPKHPTRKEMNETLDKIICDLFGEYEMELKKAIREKRARIYYAQRKGLFP